MLLKWIYHILETKSQSKHVISAWKTMDELATLAAEKRERARQGVSRFPYQEGPLIKALQKI